MVTVTAVSKKRKALAAIFSLVRSASASPELHRSMIDLDNWTPSQASSQFLSSFVTMNPLSCWELKFVWLGFFCTRRVYLPLFSYILSTSANAIVVWNAPNMGVKWTSNCAFNDWNCLAVESHFSIPSYWGESRIFHLHCSIYRKCSYQYWNIRDKKILIWALCKQQASDCMIYQLCVEGWYP